MLDQRGQHLNTPTVPRGLIEALDRQRIAERLLQQELLMDGFHPQYHAGFLHEQVLRPAEREVGTVQRVSEQSQLARGLFQGAPRRRSLGGLPSGQRLPATAAQMIG